MSRDDLYLTPRDRIVDFVFDEHVARVFDDMVQRSVPGYATICALIGIFATEYARPGTRCYDLGCSLGGATLAMRRCIAHAETEIIAVDNSPVMVERCRETISRDQAPVPVRVICADILDTPIENASIVVLNFTLQFIAPERRAELMARIHRGLAPGGVLILSEKIAFTDSARAAFHETRHRAFKRANRYTDLEISQKRASLENVLIADTLETHRARLQSAGFSRVETWFQCLNFVSLVAFK